MSKSFAILLPYFSRREQWLLAYKRMIELYADLPVRVYICVDDPDCPSLLDLPGNVLFFSNRRHKYRNPGVLFNFLASVAEEDLLVLSNPEIYHLQPVLQDAMLHARTGEYRVYGCKNLTGLCLPGFQEDQITDHGMPWYQHSVHRPAGLHFCSVISRGDFWCLGGFDPGYDAGYAWEDTDFFCKVQQSGMKIVQVDDPYVGHQPHERPPQEDPLLIAKIVRNRWYFLSKWSQYMQKPLKSETIT